VDGFFAKNRFKLDNIYILYDIPQMYNFLILGNHNIAIAF